MSRKRIIILIIPVLALLSLGIYLLIRPSVEEQPPLQKTPTESSAEQAVANRESLPPDKEKIKQSLLQPLEGSAGTLSEGPQFKIDYLPAFDVFEVGIKTTDIAQAKDNAIAWFKKRGFDESDICNLPVTFYLVSDVAKEYEGSGLIFNPLPDFCPEKGSFTL